MIISGFIFSNDLTVTTGLAESDSEVSIGYLSIILITASNKSTGLIFSFFALRFSLLTSLCNFWNFANLIAAFAAYKLAQESED